MLRRLLLSSTIVLLPGCSNDSGPSGSGDSSGDTGSDDGSGGTSQDGGSGTDDTGDTGNTSSSGGTSTGDTSETGGTGTGDTETTTGTSTTSAGDTETTTGTSITSADTTTTSDTGATTSGGLTCGDLNEEQCLAANGCMGLQGQQYVPADNQTWCLDSTPVFVYCTPVGDPCLPATQTVCIGDDTYEAWSQCELPDGVTACSPPQGYTGPC